MLIAGGGAVAALGAFSLSPLGTPVTRKARQLAASQPWARRFLSLSQGTLAEWEAQIGSVFSVGGGISMRLAGVRAFASPGARPRGVSRKSAFLAVFDVEGGAQMASDLIYTVSHPQYGPLQMFLSASADPRSPARMLAVFN